MRTAATALVAHVALMAAGKEGYNKATAAQKEALQKFTGSYSGFINDSLISGKLTKIATNAKNAMQKHSVPLPVGLKIRRDYPFAGSESVAVGDVIHSKALQSCTTVESGVFGGNYSIVITMGEGVRGMPAQKFSNVPGEKEVIMMPGQRYAVTKMEKKGTKTH